MKGRDPFSGKSRAVEPAAADAQMADDSLRLRVTREVAAGGVSGFDSAGLEVLPAQDVFGGEGRVRRGVEPLDEEFAEFLQVGFSERVNLGLGHE